MFDRVDLSKATRIENRYFATTFMKLILLFGKLQCELTTNWQIKRFPKISSFLGSMTISLILTGKYSRRKKRVRIDLITANVLHRLLAVHHVANVIIANCF